MHSHHAQALAARGECSMQRLAALRPLQASTAWARAGQAMKSQRAVSSEQPAQQRRCILCRAQPPDPQRDEALRDPRPAVLDQEVDRASALAEPGPDPFEGEQWEWLGWSSNILLPLLMAGILTAGLVARGNWLNANDPLPRSNSAEIQTQRQSPNQSFIPGV